MGAAVAAAVMRRREQEVIDDFRAAGATSPDRAQSYTALGFGETLAVKRLRDRAVIREAAPGVFYLDEEVWTAVRRMRHRFLAVFLVVLALMLIGILVGNIKS
ncbi:MAG TPA: hypothetical protein VIH53_02720 [Gemmatimonadaceae bacterium]|jgi:hypothetical protein